MNATVQSPSHDKDLRAIAATGALAHVEAKLAAIEAQLDALPTWTPARALRAELDWVHAQVARLGAAWGKKLVVAIAGPSGAGKSTLLNALAGQEISPVGLERPTTRQVVVYRQHPENGADLVRDLGADRVLVHTVPDAVGLDNLVLVDTPDTNTVPENQQLLSEALGHADVILLVFNAFNPKVRDNVAFWAPIVRRYDAEALIPVLNMVDRVPREELEREVLPDMVTALERAWGTPMDRIYAISAKASSPHATYAEDERPLHDLNQFAALRDLLYGSLGRASQAEERRLARAEHLLVLLQSRCREALAPWHAGRDKIDRQWRALERDAAAAIREASDVAADRSQRWTRHTTLYARLAERAWGPVGWFVVVWALLLRLVAFLRADRGGQLTGWARVRVESSEANDRYIKGVVRALDRLYARRWPPLADDLVAAGFDPMVRQARTWESGLREQAEAMLYRREAATAERIGRHAAILSSWPIQLLANAPTLGLAMWVGIYTVGTFFGGQPLSGDYFSHAGAVLLVIWLASITLYQALVSMLLGRATDRAVVAALASDSEPALPDALAREIEALDAFSST